MYYYIMYLFNVDHLLFILIGLIYHVYIYLSSLFTCLYFIYIGVCIFRVSFCLSVFYSYGVVFLTFYHIFSPFYQISTSLLIFSHLCSFLSQFCFFCLSFNFFSFMYMYFSLDNCVTFLS